MTSEFVSCSFCSKSFQTGDIFEQHLKFMHNKVHVSICKLCGKKFRGNDGFDKHLTFVHGTNHWHVNLAKKYTHRMLKDFDN